MTKEQKNELVPVRDKALLTLDEASAYTGIGVCKLRELTEYEGCDMVFWVGNRRMIKRKQLEEFIDKTYSV